MKKTKTLGAALCATMLALTGCTSSDSTASSASDKDAVSEAVKDSAAASSAVNEAGSADRTTGLPWQPAVRVSQSAPGQSADW